MIGALIVLALVALLLFLVVRAIWLGITQRNVRLQLSERVPWPPDEAMGRVLAAVMPLMQDWDYRLSNQGPTSVQFTYTYRPAWLLIPCLIFFPLGLLSLLYKKRVDLTLSFAHSGEGATVSATGMAAPFIRDRLPELLAALAENENLEVSTRPSAEADQHKRPRR